MLATPAIIATISVVDTVTAALGIEAADQAIQSNAKSSGCTASAKTRARAGNGAPSKARKRIGCARVMTGAARRLDSGATRLMRPNTHATSGAVTAHATRAVVSSRAIGPCDPARRRAV